jgi:hypothetical protein
VSIKLDLSHRKENSLWLPKNKALKGMCEALQEMTGGWRKLHMIFHGLYTSPKMFRAKVKNEMGGAFGTREKGRIHIWFGGNTQMKEACFKT